METNTKPSGIVQLHEADRGRHGVLLRHGRGGHGLHASASRQVQGLEGGHEHSLLPAAVHGVPADRQQVRVGYAVFKPAVGRYGRHHANARQRPRAVRPQRARVQVDG